MTRTTKRWIVVVAVPALGLGLLTWYSGWSWWHILRGRGPRTRAFDGRYVLDAEASFPSYYDEMKNADDERKLKAENTGVLISSGLIAGGALTAVIIAFIVLGYNLLGTPPPGTDDVPTFLDRAREAMGVTPNPWLGLMCPIAAG